jgi:SMC interacting uncharacterized protein involved in chromosome segregation
MKLGINFTEIRTDELEQLHAEIEALRKQLHDSVKAAATIVEHVSAEPARKVTLTDEIVEAFLIAYNGGFDSNLANPELYKIVRSGLTEALKSANIEVTDG